MEKVKFTEILSVDDWLIVLATFIVVMMFGMNWFFNNNELVREEPIKIHIKKGMSFKQVSDTLYKYRLINSKNAFLIVGKLLNAEKKIKSGYHRLLYGKSNYDYLNDLVTGKTLTNIRVTIPEGLYLTEIATLLGEVLDFDKESFLQVARDSLLLREYEIDNSSFEGFLMPDTYELAEVANPIIVLRELANEFKKFYDEKIKPKEQMIGLTKKQIVTLASIIQGETSHIEEMPIIAGVYLNRLKRGMKLQADPTVAYAIGTRQKRITYKDLKINSIYNTYLYYDLPPGPINCPGRDALLAVVNPAKHNYFYFVASGDGKTHIFSKNFSEHKRNVRIYRNSRR